MLLYTRRHKTKMSNAVGSENCLFVQENVQNSLYLTQYSNEKKTTTKLSIQLITIAMERRKKNPQRGGGGGPPYFPPDDRGGGISPSFGLR